MIRTVLMAGLAAAAYTGAAAAQAPAVLNDFPTEARADYVLGCMTANGQSQDALRRCSCSIDVIATIIPFKRYEEASTFLSMGQVTGEAGTMFRGAAESKAAIGDLRRAQAEAEIRCF
jgi:hypothetical protein